MSSIQFNLSHSGDAVVMAFARDRDVGIDIEQWLGAIHHEEISEHFFSAHERQALRALGPEQRAAGFFSCWSRKEAYLKATGLGVTAGLDHFDVTLSPGEPARLLEDRHLVGAESHWSMHNLDVRPGYSGALVALGDDWHPQYFEMAPGHAAL